LKNFHFENSKFQNQNENFKIFKSKQISQTSNFLNFEMNPYMNDAMDNQSSHELLSLAMSYQLITAKNLDDDQLQKVKKYCDRVSTLIKTNSPLRNICLNALSSYAAGERDLDFAL